jgi:hypothetical protein
MNSTPSCWFRAPTRPSMFPIHDSEVDIDRQHPGFHDANFCKRVRRSHAVFQLPPSFHFLHIRGFDHATSRSKRHFFIWLLFSFFFLNSADELGVLCLPSLEIVGETEISSVLPSFHMVSHFASDLEPVPILHVLTNSVVLFVLCILLQVFSLKGYASKEVQIVLYTWVS